jgi:two-component system chemotaxis sensor kinase CheA
VLQDGAETFGLMVDAISDTQEIVVKPLGQHLKGLNCYAGATIMGDGKIALILDIPGIAARSEVFAASNQALTETRAIVSSQADHRKSLLLFRVGDFRRIAMPLAEVSRLESISRAKVERASGHDVVQYRERLLPLVPLAGILEATPVQLSGEDSEDMNVVVYRAGATDLGLVVDEITDIVQESVTSLYGSDRAGLLGSAIVGGQATDFLDLEAVAGWASLAGGNSLARLEAILGSSVGVALEEGVLP